MLAAGFGSLEGPEVRPGLARAVVINQYDRKRRRSTKTRFNGRLLLGNNNGKGRRKKTESDCSAEHQQNKARTKAKQKR